MSSSNEHFDEANESNEDVVTRVTELEMLKQRASLMGIKFSNNISVETLRSRINDRLSSEKGNEPPDRDDDEDEENNEPVVVAPVASAPAPIKDAVVSSQPAAPVRKKTLREELLETEMALVRLRITNLDPKKKDVPGEILTVANEYIGTVRKYIPYGEATDNGYHVPMCLYRQLKERTFVSIRTRKGLKGQTIVESSDAREFALEVLEPLSKEELARLAAAQAATSSE
jgi:hypothetical protein